mgnify:CR=1 FL=1
MSESYFQFELIKKLNLENKTNNFVISPIGIELIISLCSNGAEGTTQQQMIELLKHQTIDEVNNIAKKMLVESEKNEKVKIANGILTKINAEKNFFEKGTKDYEAKIEILEDYNTVNKWVNEKTNGKIKSIIENLSPDVMIVLLNAIYFEAFWKEKFNINHTYEKEFFNIDNTKIYINLMFLRGKPLNYYEDDIIKAVKLDYDIKDNSINAIVILPKNEDLLEKNMNELIENLNEEIFYKIVDKLNEENSKTKVNLYLPKFEIENNFNISEILKNLGMVKAFMKEAEFKGISTKLKLFINKVLQKNYINVNEDGTQACSITELEVMLESYLTKDETAKDFIANRPFLFILRNEQCPKGHDIIFFTKVCKFNKVYNN